MDRRPTLEAGPPALIERVVRLLVPAGAREHVLGDLAERYSSPWQYVGEALRTIPFVVASRIRRTTTVGAVVVQAFLMSVGFMVGAGGFRRSAIPVVAGLVGLVLRDAYKQCVSMSAKLVCIDLAVGAGCVLVSQAVVAATQPALTLPLPGAIAGAATFGVLFLLRLQNPGLGAYPRDALVQTPASLDALVTEVRLYERMTRRAGRIEAWAGVGLAAFFVVPLVSAPNWAMRVGWGLASAYGAYVAWIMARYSPRPMPDGLGFEGSLTFYRLVLERQHARVRTMWLWYVLPFVPSLVFITAGAAMFAVERGRPMWPAAVMCVIAAAIGLMIHRGSVDAAQKLRLRIDALRVGDER